MPPTKKFESGYSKRQKKEKDEQFVQSQRGAIDRFIIKQTSECPSNEESRNVEQNVFESDSLNNDENNEGERVGVDIDEVDEVMEEEEPMVEEADVCEPENVANLNGNDGEKDDIAVNIYDPRNWDNLDTKWEIY
ncbi:LOW QUALITY PROTEIN: hypothetical protein OSB04_028396 [Centaurea solstitialis]|uniref:Uncharacterized protein n=1 Tax=Centaurea solstitialis TaxID=347529 RepID=A0AA38SFN6_9ASTR|nr:LOW QUALITY PROTEIN: hypothetical protein OSB04_028396 [Centaurea solstitialis]